MSDTLVGRIDARTRPDRERAIDGYRALAILGVILGHWLVGSLVMTDDGALRISSPLGWMGELAPASWFLQMLGLFFLVGGYAATLGLQRARSREESYAGWLGRRYARLGRPVIAAAAVSALCLGMLSMLGVPSGTLRTWIVLFVQPLWFIGIYLVVTALSGLAVAADRALGAWAALPPLVVVVAVDLLRYGPLQDSMPGWLGLVNLVPAWFFAYQLGVSWARGSLGRLGAWVVLIGGVALFALLIGRLGYPWSMVGVPGEARTNSHPPSLLVPALAAVQSGLAVLLRSRVERVLRRPRIWAGAVLVNLSALTIFCWHQVPNVLASAAAAGLGGVAGLTDLPDSLSWVGWRLVWLPVLGVMLASLVVAMSRFERPWTGLPRPTKAVTGMLTVAFVAVAAMLY